VPKRARSLLLLSWPAWTAWGLALVFLLRPVPGGSLVLLYVGVLLATYLSSLVALAGALVALVVPVPRTVRLGACALNLSVLILVTQDGLSYHALQASAWSRVPIATARCKQYWETAQRWATSRGRPPDTLAEMERPLHPGEEPFVVVERDPWGGPFTLHREDDRLRVRSRGPDGAEGTDDDIAWPPDD